MITSLRSPQIGRVRELLETHSPKRREELGEYVVEGMRAVDTALNASESAVLELFATSGQIDRYKDRDPTLVSDDVMKKMSGTVSPQGVLAVLSLPLRKISELVDKRRIVFLSSINDPGNLGTVIRNAHAFGFDAVVLSQGSVDPFSGKVVRASVGSITAPAIFNGYSFTQSFEVVRSSHKCFALDMNGEKIGSFGGFDKLLVVLGSEAHGLPDEISSVEGVTTIAIDMPGEAESLNVATAAAIAMYEISRS